MGVRTMPYVEADGKPQFAGMGSGGSGGGGEHYTLPTATASRLGGVKIGSGISVENDGTISASGGGSYTLPTATASRLGGVKIGSGVDVSEDGTISVSGGGGGSLNLDVSTTEHKTGYKWNGKDVWVVLLSGTGHAFNYSSHITGTLDKCIKLEGYYQISSTSSYYYPIGVKVGNSEYSCEFGPVENTVQLSCGSSAEGGMKNIAMYYTKTS